MAETATIRPLRRLPTPVLYGVFVLSGLSALLYQMIWQRSLLTLYGSNVESVAMVVTAFLLGLGLGSLAGGWVSKHPRLPLVLLFALAELGIGLYGLLSLKLFAWVGEITLGAGTLATGLLAFTLIFIPTLLMGATLPLLVAHRVNTTGAVGKSVSWLYFVNTLGAALGAFLSAFVILGHFGQSGSVRLAAVLNTLAAVTILVAWALGKKEATSAETGEGATQSPAQTEVTSPAPLEETFPPYSTDNPSTPVFTVFSFRNALWYAALSGFLALSWEILWARFYNVVTGSRAPAFGAMLGSYLLGLALGALVSMRWQKQGKAASVRSLGWLFLMANLVALLVVPVAARLVTVIPEHHWLPNGFDLASWMWTLPLVMIASALQGTILPLLCHVAIPPDNRSGQRLSYIYLANIAGSGTGSLLTGFVLLDLFSLKTTAAGLVALAILCSWSSITFGRSQQKAFHINWLISGGAALIPLLGYVGMTQLWERLYYKTSYNGQRFAKTWESRHGVINVEKDGTVLGNGVYDGEIKTTLTYGDWHVRPYFLSAVHEAPKRVLIIGMSAGPWTQIIAHHPQVEHIDVVEISRTYLDVVAAFPEVSGILHDPKVHIHIDDGRRWLKRNPEKRYDAIVMNTTHHWREFASSLLSVEFLTLAKAHLAPGGIVLWNCTSSGRAAKTGMEVFPHTMMVMNNCLGSNEPIRVDKERWRRVLSEYPHTQVLYDVTGAPPQAGHQPRFVKKPLFDLSTPEGRTELEKVLSLCDRDMDPPPDDLPEEVRWWIVSPERMQRLWGHEKPITDDNLGHEYR